MGDISVQSMFNPDPIIGIIGTANSYKNNSFNFKHQGLQDNNGLTKEGTIANTMLDPLDIFGVRANDTANKQQNIVENYLQGALNNAQSRYQQAQELNRPYQSYGVNALQNIDNPITNYSSRYYNDLENGTDTINNRLAASGLFNSSYALDKLAQLQQGLAEEDINRQYLKKIQALKTGMQGAGNISQAGLSYASSAADALSGAGSSLGSILSGYGKQRNASLQTVGNSLSQLGTYLDNR